MAIVLSTIDHGVAVGASSDPLTTTLPATAAANDLLVFQATVATSGDAIDAVATTTNIAWNAALRNATNFESESQWARASASAGTNFSVGKAAAGSALNHVLNIASFTGFSPTGTLNAGQSTVATGTGTVSAINAPTPTAGCECLLVAVLRGAGTKPSAPSGWSTLTSNSGGPNLYLYQYVASASGNYPCAPTWGSSGNWVAQVMVLENPVATPLLAITQQPGAILSGATFSPVVTVEARTNGVSVDTAIGGAYTCTATITTGAGTFVGSNTAVFASGVATFPGLGVRGSGSHIITFALTSYTSAVSSSFVVSATVAVVISDPESVLSGASIPVTVTRYVGVDVDTASSAAVTITKPHGPGTLGGTTSGNYVAGVATLSPTLTWDGTGSHIHTLRATDGPSSAVDTSSNIRVRKDFYFRAGGYHPAASVRETTSPYGEKMYYGVQVPTGANSGTALGVLFFLDGVGEAYAGSSASNADGAAGSNGGAETAISNSQTVDEFGVLFNSQMATLPFIKVDLPIPYNDDLIKRAYEQGAINAVLSRLEADGANINRRKLYWLGYSTGGIESEKVRKFNPGVLAALCSVDGSFQSWNLTSKGGDGLGFGVAFGPWDASYWDATAADTVLMPLVGADMVNDDVATLFIHGTNTVLYGSSNRNIMSVVTQSTTAINDGMAARLSALGLPAIVTNNCTGTFTITATDKHVYVKSSTLGHGPIRTNAANGTNGPQIIAWLDNQERPAAGAVPIKMHHYNQQRAA